VPTVTVNAYGFAATFKLRDLLDCFRSAAEARVEKDRLLASFGPGRYALAYDFGAVVFVGAEAAERQKVVDALLAHFKSEPHRPLEESFLIETGGPQIEVRFDRVIVPELLLPVVEIVAEMVAQSVAMDYYAGDVLEIELQTDRITQELASKGRVPRGTRRMIRFIGQCIATRNDIISTLALFDKPDATWENEQLDRLWNGLHQMLELDDRYRALEAKLRIFQDNMEVLVDLTRQGQTLRLELIVAVLIVMEIAVMFWQIALPAHG
jgi:required for meiotic nuclear division protein 1